MLLIMIEKSQTLHKKHYWVSNLHTHLFLIIAVFATNQAAAADVELLHSIQPGQITPAKIVGIEFDSKGVLYALDGEQARLSRIVEDTPETVIDGISLQQQGKAKKQAFSAFALIDDATVAIADSSTAHIALLGLDGTVQANFGEKGKKAGMLKKPHDLAFSINRRAYIADTANHEIAVYSPTGVFLYGLGQGESDPQQRLKQPEFIAIDRQERAYALQAGKKPVISIYEPSGQLIKRFDSLKLKSIFGKQLDLSAMAVAESGWIYLANSGSGKIIQFDWEADKILQSFGSKGSGPGQFRDVTALAIAHDDRLAVVDQRNNKLDIYQVSGAEPSEERAWLANVGDVEFIPLSCQVAYQLENLDVLCLNTKAKKVSILDTAGKERLSLKAAFKAPSRAAYNAKHIVILDKGLVHVFDMQGKLISTFGGSGKKDGQLKKPSDAYIRNKRIYIADSGNKRIQVFSLKGVYLDKFPKAQDKKNPTLVNPSAVAVDANGKVYVADNGRKRILAFSDKYELIYEIGEADKSPGQFKSLADLALDTDNNLYVLTQTGLKEQTVQVYSGPEKVFEFGAYSKKVDTGIGRGLTLSVSPTAKTVVSVFDSIDPKNPGLIAFNYLQVPPPVSELAVAGGESVTELRWQAPPGAYINQYHIYGSEGEGQGYQRLVSVNGPYAKVDYAEDDKPHHTFRVSAVSGFGTEGPLSSARINNFVLAKQQLDEEAVEQAIATLREDLRLNPQQPRAMQLLGKTSLQQGQYAEAAELFARLRGFEGFEQSSINLQIEALYLQQEYSQAMALAQEAIQHAKDDVASYINCGRLSLKIGDPVGGLVCLEDGLKLEASNVDLILLTAESYIQLGTIDQGIKQLEQAIAAAPEDATLWLRAGQLHYDLNRYAEAKTHFEKSLELEPTLNTARLGLANTHLALKEIPQAKTIAMKLAAEEETEATGNYLLGWVALQQEQPGLAVVPLSKATRAQPDNTEAWLALADAYEALKKPEQAETSLRSALETNPDSFAVLKRLGMMLLAKEDYVSAAEYLQQASAQNNKDFAVVYATAEASFLGQQYLQASNWSQQAVALKENDIEALTLAAKVAKQRGKTGQAIEYLKTALTQDKNGYGLHVQLGELYLDNNLYEQAEAALDQAVVIDKNQAQAYVLLGGMFMQRRLFDKAIAAYESAVKHDSGSDNRLALDTAYAEKKRSLEFSSNAPQILLEDLRLQPVFSAAYKQYSEKPVGLVRVRNVSGVEYGNVKVSFEIKGYMDFPTSQTLEKLAPNSNQELSLLAAFNNRVLEIDEDTGVQVEVKLSYVREGRDDAISLSRAMTIYGKNAVVWAEPNMVGSFVTPKDDSLRNFVRQAVNEFKPDAGPLSDNLVTAMTLFNAFSAHGIRYEIDPNNPFADVKVGQVDYVQFGRETLRLKSGDCDDLSVLFSAALENLGIETAVIDVPGHLLMMFSTNLPAEQASQISAQRDLLVIRDDKVWVPLEVTMISTSFAEAWAEGAKKYQQYSAEEKLAVIPLKQAWQEYQPVTLRPSSYELKLPLAERVKPMVQREQAILLQKSLDQQIALFEAVLANNPDDHMARMQIAITYAKNGLYPLAMEALDELTKRDPNNSAVYNNRANIFFQQGDLQRAREAYEQAERLDPSDGGIKMNLALVAYQQGQITQARKKYEQALGLSDELATAYATFGKLLQG